MIMRRALVLGLVGCSVISAVAEFKQRAPPLRRSLSSLLELADHSHGRFDVKSHVQKLEDKFPHVVPENMLIGHMSAVLGKHGFTPATAINMVSTCRDEICHSFTATLAKVWDKPSFDISSLAGMVFCGSTGFKAAMAHAPVGPDGKERYVFWVASHMALSGANEAGEVWRPGRDKPSHACGALLAVLKAIQTGKLHLQLQHDDVEMSLIKQEVLDYVEYGHVPDLTELTYAVHECILDRVQKTADSAVNLKDCEYVIISGIQVHTGFTQNFFWPGTATLYSEAGSVDLMGEYKASVAQDKRDMFAGLVMV